jgi:hypothetical protein
VWAVFVTVWVFGWVGVDAYWLFTESGPVGALRSWQLEHLGAWVPKLTVLVLFVAQIGVAVAIKVAIERVFGVQLVAKREQR